MKTIRFLATMTALSFGLSACGVKPGTLESPGDHPRTYPSTQDERQKTQQPAQPQPQQRPDSQTPAEERFPVVVR